MGQLMALERRLQNVETIKKRYQETTDTDISAGYVLKLDQTDLNGNRYKLQWFLPHHYVINPHKPENVRRVCNAAAKYQSVSLNNKLLSGPDMLQCLIGINFRSREHQIALSADIEAMFLQIALPSDDSRCLLFSWPEDSKHNMEFYDYKQHVSGAKSLPNCANYSFHKVANDNAVNHQILVRSVQRTFYMDDCLKTVISPQEAN